MLERQSSRKDCSEDDLNIRVFKFKIYIHNMTDPNALSKQKPCSNKLAYANTQKRQGKLESRPTVTRLSLGCLILVERYDWVDRG